MANRNYNRYQALTKEVKALFAQVSIGSTGAPTLSAAASLGVTSVARTAAGAYTITLDDKYMDLLQITVSVQKASGAPASLAMVVRAQAVASAKTIQIAFVDASGANVELDSGSVLRIKIDLKNSSVTR